MPIVHLSILLGLADGEALPDPDVQKAALNVIINSVCGPMSRVNYAAYCDCIIHNCLVVSMNTGSAFSHPLHDK